MPSKPSFSVPPSPVLSFEMSRRLGLSLEASPASVASGIRSLWAFQEGAVYLNHGSFGACPKLVLEAQDRWRRRMEAQLITFFVRDYEELLDIARLELAEFLDAPSSDLVFLPNATHGVSTVLHSWPWKAGDQILLHDHVYGACRNAALVAAQRHGLEVVIARLPWPCRRPEETTEAILAAVTPRTRLALLDHITSPTALILPMAAIVRELAARGVETLVDGAHAPGMIEISLREIAAAFYTGNCHKWLCSPKGSAFLYARPDMQPLLHPLATSHGLSSPRTGRSRFRLEFDWTGTSDPTAYLATADAILFCGSLLQGGWPALRQRNRSLALFARERLASALEIEPPCPPSMIGWMSSLPLPPRFASVIEPEELSPRLQEHLWKNFAIEIPIIPWQGQTLLRLSSHLYNTPHEIDLLLHALQTLP